MPGRESGIDVVGSTAGGDDTVRALRTLATDVVLADVPSPENAWVVALVRAVPGTKIVGLSVPDADPELPACAEAGVAGYVTRDGWGEDVVAAAEAAVLGEVLCSHQ